MTRRSLQLLSLLLLMIAVVAAAPGFVLNPAGATAQSKDKKTNMPPAYQKYGGVEGRNGKYLVLNTNYGDWFANTSDSACEESQRLCTDPRRCELTREVTLEELRAECLPMVHEGITSKNKLVIVQTGAGHTGSTWQLRSLVYLLQQAKLPVRDLHAPKNSNLTQLRAWVDRNRGPSVIKTHEYYRRELSELGDVFFTSIDLRHRNYHICSSTHPNKFPEKSCKCCYAAWHSKNVYSVRLAEAMGAAISLGLDVESIDFDEVLASTYSWYRRKYHKNITWI